MSTDKRKKIQVYFTDDEILQVQRLRAAMLMEGKSQSVSEVVRNTFFDALNGQKQ